MSTVIGLGGHREAGKDAIADHLVAEHGFVKLGMSDPLHKAMLALDPLVGIGVRIQEEASNHVGFSRIKETKEARYSDIIAERGYVEAKKEPEVRTLLQKLGTEVGRRMFGEDVWTDIAVRNINALVAQGKSVVITGVRFPNEVTMFDRVTGATVHTAWVSRPSKERVLDSASKHSSENSISAVDLDSHIINNGTLDELHAAARVAFGLVSSTPQCKVLLDGAAIVDFVMEAPNSPGMVVVESRATGPMVVDAGRVSELAS